ncbi:DUF6252 family protein [Snuella sedimenti]|uniref:Uncharacterized protein n=1 Tax=Snuella sedimenti TaxID=2798802 RepID=A0A8J7J4N4_9FLAO|nr:DUF6252 family protein [Snuella sedimenti]MBJ6368483.1 hypothetical protein [Snuella sedimenti]
MKAFKVSFVLLFTFLLTSCNIEPYEGDDKIISVAPGVLQVEFDSKRVAFETTTATVLSDVININGLRAANGEVLTLTVFANTTGTYQLGVAVDQVKVSAVTYINSSVGEVWISASDFITSHGEVTITEIDEVNKTISGSFFFTGYSTTGENKEFTKGVFNQISYGTDVLPNSGDNTFSAKVDGVIFEEDGVQGALLSLSGTSTIMISATKNNLQSITITVDANITAGEYSFATLEPPMGQYSLSLTEAVVSEDGGKLVITEHDVANKKISGTFYFTASPLISEGASYEITEGSFEVTYI